MSFVSALPWTAWAFFALIPMGILALYFLKLKRQPLEVPSTFLWKRTIEDLHVNSLIQRLRNNLLLFLQLLFITFAALALLQPGSQGGAGPARRVIYLLDMSASMAARIRQESARETRRFDRAKEQIAAQLKTLRSDDEAMLIGFSDRADILQEFTFDKRRLLDALEQATVTNHPTDLREALRAAAGLANPNRTSQAGDVMDVQVADAMPADLEIYSDGGFPSVADFNLGNLNPTFHLVGDELEENMGILAFSAERNAEDPEQIQVFARVTNFGKTGKSTQATLSVDGDLIDAQNVEMAAGDEAGLTFTLRRAEATKLELNLEIDDALAEDNRAYAALSPSRQASILILTPGNRALSLALQTKQISDSARLEFRDPDYLQSDEYRKRAGEGRDDLIIFDRCSPTAMPQVNTFFIGALPPGINQLDRAPDDNSAQGRIGNRLSENPSTEEPETIASQWSAGEIVSPLIPIDIDRTHPLMRFLDLYSLRIVEGRSLKGPRGSKTLIEADAGPILMLGPREGYEDLIMGFELLTSQSEGGVAYNTDWPVQRSWPVFVFNLVRYLGGVSETTSATSVRPGETLALRVDNRLSKVIVIPPQGREEEVAVEAAGLLPYANTDVPGIYQIKTPDKKSTIALFAVNLFDPRESDLTPAKEIELGYETVQGIEITETRTAHWWRWVLITALGVLTIEWVIFNRRML